MKKVLLKNIAISSLFFAVWSGLPGQAEAVAETVKIYGALSDANVVANHKSTWDMAHSLSEGNNIVPSWEYIESFSYTYSNTDYIIYRAFFNFDTSLIPDDAIITDAKLKVYVHRVHNDDSDQYAYMGLYQGLLGSIPSVVPSSFTKCGDSVTNPTPGAPVVDIDNIITNDYLAFDLDQNGKSWISKNGYTSLCLRDGHDAENQAIEGGPYTYSGVRMKSANSAGTEFDPYLEVTYETPDEEENELPLYTQIESLYPSLVETADWEDDTYAYGSQEWCGDTIGGCGCAITSGVMAGRNAGITTDVVGRDVNPKNINKYLRSVGGYTSDGSVYWLAMQAYLGELVDGKLATRFKYQGAVTGSGADEYLETEGEYAVLAFKNSLGHFVWLPGKTETGYIVRDPFWYLTETSNDANGTSVKDYNDSFDSARVFKVLDEAEAYSGDGVEMYLKGTAELVYKDVAGNTVGYTEDGIVVDIDNSSYGNAEVIGLNGVPSTETDGRHLLVYDAQKEFTIDVIGTGFGEFEVELFTISETGEVQTFTFSGQTIPGVTSTFTINIETGEVTEEPITYEQFLEILGVQLDGYTTQQKAFFMKWAEKMFNDMEEKTVSQALQSIEVYGKLLVAKKVDSPVLSSVLPLLMEDVKGR